MDSLETLLAFAWRPALAVIPIALLVAAVCRLLPNRPAMRHGLWLTVLCWFAISGFLPTLRMPVRDADAVDVDSVELATHQDQESEVHNNINEGVREDREAAEASDVSAPSLAVGVRTERDAEDASHVHWSERARQTESAGQRALHHSTTPPLTNSPLHRQTTAPTPSPRICGFSQSSNFAPNANTNVRPQPSAPSEPASIPRRSRDFSPGSPVASTMPKAPAVAVLDPLTRAATDSEREAALPPLVSTSTAVDPSLLDNEAEWLALRAAATAPIAADHPDAAAQSQDEITIDVPTQATTAPREPSRAERVAVAMLNVRDAAAQIPLFPAEIWLAGAALVVLTVITRLATGRRMMTKTWHAPAEVMHIVRDVAKQLDITAPPTVMIDRDVSPMIWCGRGFRLVLPARLWDELDNAGRRAVVCHELAHLRRRDHWVRRFELLVTAVFWWHPVLWYVRHRIDEEADLSCDAWVAYLLPQQRRAYAQALIQTREYVSQGVPTGLGIGLTSARAKRIARRIHMIMTSQRQPGFPVLGMLLAASVMVAGWVALPTEACPPEKRKSSCDTPAPAPTPAPEADDASMFGNDKDQSIREEIFAFLNSHDEDEDEAEEAEIESRERAAEMAELEVEMAELKEEMKALEREFRNNGERRNQLRRRVQSPARVRAPRPPRAPRASGFAQSGAKISRTYKMPKDKLAKFTKLMVIDDVPILVSPRDDSIEVQATESEHAIVAAFIDMIRDGWEDKKYQLPDHKREAMWGLMALNSVPIRVSHSGNAISAEATKRQHEIFGAFCELIHPTGNRAATLERFQANLPRVARQPRAPRAPRTLSLFANGQNNELDSARALLKQVTQKAEGRAKSLRNQQRQMRQQARQLERQAQQREREAEKLQRHAEKRQRELEGEVRRLEEELRRAEQELHQANDQAHDDDHDHDHDHGHRDKLEALHDQHRQMMDTKSHAMDEIVQQLERQMHEFNVQAEALQRAAEAIEHKAESFDGQNDRIHDRIEQLQELLRGLERVSIESKAFEDAWEVVQAVERAGVSVGSNYANIAKDLNATQPVFGYYNAAANDFASTWQNAYDITQSQNRFPKAYFQNAGVNAALPWLTYINAANSLKPTQKQKSDCSNK